jgi:hypothetical protein
MSGLRLFTVAWKGTFTAHLSNTLLHSKYTLHSVVMLYNDANANMPSLCRM